MILSILLIVILTLVAVCYMLFCGGCGRCRDKCDEEQELLFHKLMEEKKCTKRQEGKR